MCPMQPVICPPPAESGHQGETLRSRRGVAPHATDGDASAAWWLVYTLIQVGRVGSREGGNPAQTTHLVCPGCAAAHALTAPSCVRRVRVDAYACGRMTSSPCDGRTDAGSSFVAVIRVTCLHRRASPQRGLAQDRAQISHTQPAQYAIVSFCFDTLTCLNPGRRRPRQAGWAWWETGGTKEASGGKSIAVALSRGSPRAAEDRTRGPSSLAAAGRTWTLDADPAVRLATDSYWSRSPRSNGGVQEDGMQRRVASVAEYPVGSRTSRRRLPPAALR